MNYLINTSLLPLNNENSFVCLQYLNTTSYCNYSKIQTQINFINIWKHNISGQVLGILKLLATPTKTYRLMATINKETYRLKWIILYFGYLYFP